MQKNQIKSFIKMKRRILRRPIFLLSSLGFLLSLSMIIFAYYSKLVIDKAINESSDNYTMHTFILVSIALIMLVLCILYLLVNRYNTSQTNRILKKSFYSKIIHASLIDIESYSTDELMQTINDDLEYLSKGLVNNIPKSILFITYFVGSFIMIFILDHLFSYIILAFGLFLFILSKIILFSSKTIMRSLKNFGKYNHSLIKKSFDNIDVIKSFEAETSMINKHSKAEDTYSKVLWKKKLDAITKLGLQYVFFVFTYSFIIIFGAIRFNNNSISIGSLVAILIILHTSHIFYINLLRFIHDYKLMENSIERSIVLDQLEQESIHSINEHTHFEALILEDLSHKYHHQYVLNRLSHRINKGDFVHVHGETEKAKTVLFKLLLGLYQPQEGFIFFVHGKNKFLCDPTTRHLFSYVNQRNMFIQGTIRENLQLFRESSEDNLIQACQIVKIYDTIQALPKQFDTWIGDSGLKLSEGDLLRLAIARALLKNTPILLLDDVTSKLEPEIEKKILSSIKSLTNKTCFIVSHRKFSIDLVNQSIEL